MCWPIIDPSTSWFGIMKLATPEVQVVRKTKEIIEVILDKPSECIEQLFNKSWLSFYPSGKSIIYDNGSKFKLFFESVCEELSLERAPTTINNPQANSLLERTHKLCSNMIRTSSLDMQNTCTPEIINELIANIGWVIFSTHYNVLGSLPGAEIFGRD